MVPTRNDISEVLIDVFWRRYTLDGVIRLSPLSAVFFSLPSFQPGFLVSVGFTDLLLGSR